MRKQGVMLDMAACSNLSFLSRINNGTYCLEGFIGFLTSLYAQNYMIDVSFRFIRVLRDLHTCFTQ